MKMKFIIILFMLPLHIATMSQTKVIAHRGFWNTAGSSENSIAALIKADSIGCYGSEFDVRMTKDQQLIINHDLMIKGRIIQLSSVNKLTKLKLSNGEFVPTLDQYLKRAQKLRIKLILELKPLQSPKSESKAVRMIVEMVRKYGLEKRMEYISFSLHAVKEFIRQAPDKTPVYYLNGDLSPAELKDIGCAGPDYHHSVFRKNPEWIAQCKQLGLYSNTWTVNERDEMMFFLDNGVDFVTTNEPVMMLELINRKEAK